MRTGARDYLTKPFGPDELSAHIRGLLTEARKPEPHHAKPAPQAQYAPSGYLFGKSEVMRKLDAQVQSLANYPTATVLITGPTGTGKSAVARKIHELTCGASAPFIEIDCSTIPRELCESELFGHEKGAFTGAHRTKQGLFEAAGQGTAFLDEIGELDLPIQAKFLRVLEARQFKRVGGHSVMPMQARIIAATNRSPADLVHTGQFREDLYFRLNVVEIYMPPLNQRGDDILMLAEHFLKHFAQHYQKQIIGFTDEALVFLQQYPFPGNVRELRNLIERAVIRCQSSKIENAHLVSAFRPSALSCRDRCPPAPPQAPPSNHNQSFLNLAELEKHRLAEALAAAKGNKSRAAKLVGLSRTAFLRRLAKHGID
jgi:DNA-binding NtrC family response regulator